MFSQHKTKQQLLTNKNVLKIIIEYELQCGCKMKQIS